MTEEKLCQKGDIITNWGHIAIVSNPEDGYTISAGENEVIESDFGFRKNNFWWKFQNF